MKGVVLCEEMSPFNPSFSSPPLRYDDYVRTTEERHILAAQEVWRRIEQAGFIFKGKEECTYLQVSL